MDFDVFKPQVLKLNKLIVNCFGFPFAEQFPNVKLKQKVFVLNTMLRNKSKVVENKVLNLI